MPIPVDASDFKFTTDPESLAYLHQIVETMMRSFGITKDEAVGRINDCWSHVPAVVGEDEIYREFPPYWANHFMYGHKSCWWIRDRGAHNLPPLERLPYPRNPQSPTS